MLFFKTAIKGTEKERKKLLKAAQQRGRDGHSLGFQQCPSGAHPHSAIPDLSCVPLLCGSLCRSPDACFLPVAPGGRCGADLRLAWVPTAQGTWGAGAPWAGRCWLLSWEGPRALRVLPAAFSTLGDLIHAGVCNKHMTAISVANGNVKIQIMCVNPDKKYLWLERPPYCYVGKLTVTTAVNLLLTASVKLSWQLKLWHRSGPWRPKESITCCTPWAPKTTRLVVPEYGHFSQPQVMQNRGPFWFAQYCTSVKGIQWWPALSNSSVGCCTQLLPPASDWRVAVAWRLCAFGGASETRFFPFLMASYILSSEWG